MAVFFFCLLGGCLSAPPESGGSGGGEPGGDGPVGDPPGGGGPGADGGTTSGGDGGLIGGPCTPGSELDLAFVDEVAIGSGLPNVLVLVGMAVVVNPGPDPLFLPAMAVRSAHAPGSVDAMFQLEAPDGGVEMAPNQAKGSLDVSATALVARTFSESWVDTVTPVLTGSFALPAGWRGGEVVVALEIGGYRFDIEIDVVDDAAVRVAPVATSANRVTAHCDQ